MKQRKTMILINRDFQFRYAGAAVIVGVISTIVSSLVILYPLYVFEILRIPKFLPAPILLSMLFAAFINIAMVALIGVYVTHAIAGPMYAIVREFRKVEQGDWTSKMRQRKNDDLRYLVRNYNAMMDALRNQGNYEYEELTKLRALIEKSSCDEKSELLEVVSMMEDRWCDRLEGSRES